MKLFLLPCLIILTILLAFLGITSLYKPGNLPNKAQIGISFSPSYAEKLGLNWQETYLDILTNLKVKNIRLTSFWRDLEPVDNVYFFTALDFMVAQAYKHDAKIILVVGPKQPGWPECFAPDWAKQLKLEERQKQALDFIEVVVKRYQKSPAIAYWQIENEPLFKYGADCDLPDFDFLKKEVELVRKLDPTRQILVTDSGELGFWYQAISVSDIFGTTIYRKIHNPIFGFFTWPLPAGFYTLKSDLVRSLFAKDNSKTIVSELQTEPWFSKALIDTTIEEQVEIFSLEDFKNNVKLAKDTGFDEIYLWGAQWWYFMDKNNHPEYLEYAKSLF